MNILTDLHTHTIATTHAYSTITENAKAASLMGLEAIAMTDHCGEVPDSPHMWHFLNIRVLPKEIHGVRILKGAEVNICDLHGRLDMGEEIMKILDIIIASIHRPCYSGVGESDHTEAYMSAVENKYVDILGHSGAPDLAYDYEKVVKRAGELGKMLEINTNTFKIRKSNVPNCRKIAELCKKHGTSICVNSDAHYCDMIGKFDPAIEMLREIDFPEELIANRSLSALREFLKPRKEI